MRWGETKSDWGRKKRGTAVNERARSEGGKKRKSGRLTPVEAEVSVLAVCQGTGGRVCYSSVAVICLREVQSKLVQTAQPGSASWVNMQLRRGLHTTDSPWPPIQMCFMLECRPFYNPKAQWCVCVCVWFTKKSLFNASVKTSESILLSSKPIHVY